MEGMAANTGAEILDIIFRIYRTNEGIYWATGNAGFNPHGVMHELDEHAVRTGVACPSFKNGGLINIPASAMSNWMRGTVVFDFTAKTVSFQLADSVSRTLLASMTGIPIDPAYDMVEIFGIYSHRTGNNDYNPILFANVEIFTGGTVAASTPTPIATPSPAPEPTPTPEPTVPPVATETPNVTATTAPGATEEPTATSIPTAAPNDEPTSPPASTDDGEDEDSDAPNILLIIGIAAAVIVAAGVAGFFIIRRKE
jgi:hypothetical protein